MLNFKKNRYEKIIPEKPFSRIFFNPIFAIYFVITLILTLALNIASRESIWFSNWYANCIYKRLVYVIGGISSFAPFSVAEILLYVLIIVSIIKLFYNLINIIRYAFKKMYNGCLYHLFLFIRYVITMGITLLLCFTLTCGINYHRFSFVYYSDLEVKDYDVDTLIDLCNHIIDNLNECSKNVHRDEYNVFSLENTDYTYEAKLSLERLSMAYPVLAGFYPDAKPIINSKLMSYSFITGIYAPFTIEANYNNDMPDINYPFTICHELSHLRGFMREEEANFIAYLACRESSCVEFNYSGYINALSYVLSALYPNVTPEEYSAIYNSIDKYVILDLTYDSVYWNNFVTPVKEIASTVNDTYLKANNQQDGVISYGRIVDLMLADYVKNVYIK